MTEAGDHLGYVLAIAFAPDGSRVYYAAAGEGSVRVLEVASGAAVGCWPCHAGPIMELRCPGDGQRLFTASLDGSVGVLDTRDGSVILRLTGFRHGIHSLDVSPRHVAAGGFDGSVRSWDPASGAPVAEFHAHADAVTAVALLSPARLVTGSRDRTLRVWDLDTGEVEHVLTGHDAWVTRLATLGDGRRVLSAGEDGACVLWNCESGARIWRGRIDAPIWGLALAPSGEFAITGSSVTRWDIASAASRPLNGAHAERAIAVSPDNRFAALGADDGEAALYDLGRDRVVRTLARARGDSLALAAAVDTRGQRIAIGQRDGSVRLRDLDGRSRVLERSHGFMAYTLCRIGTDRFASGGFDGTVRIWDFDSGALLGELEHGGHYVFSVAASADGRRLLCGGSDRWCLWDLESQQQIRVASGIGSGVHTVAAFADDDGLVMSAGDDDTLRLWRTDGARAAVLPLGTDLISGLAWCPGRRTAVLGDARGRVSLLDLDSGRRQCLHEAHEDWIRAVHVTPDGRYAASVSQNFICRIYDLEERRLVEADALRAPVPAADFAADGSLVMVSASGALLALRTSAI
jgi:WD40 repeat protein